MRNRPSLDAMFSSATACLLRFRAFAGCALHFGIQFHACAFGPGAQFQLPDICLGADDCPPDGSHSAGRQIQDHRVYVHGRKHHHATFRRTSSCSSCVGSLKRKMPWYLSAGMRDRKSTRLNSSHLVISYAVFCLKKKKKKNKVYFNVYDNIFVSSCVYSYICHSHYR